MTDELRDDESPVQTVRETARQLGIGDNQAYEGVRRGEIPSIRIGRRILVLKAPLKRMLANAAAENLK